MKNAIVYNTTVIQFPAPPLREGNDSAELIQVAARASDGKDCVYNKSADYRHIRTLIYTNVTDAILSDLLGLYDTIGGGRRTVIWFDHLGPSYYIEDYCSEEYLDGGHRCRFIAPVRYSQTGPGRYRVEIGLEEFLSLAMPVPTTWDAAASALTGSFPVWIFKMVINGVDYWLSDQVVTGPLMFGATRPLVKEFSPITGLISQSLEEYQVTDFAIDILVDPDASPNFRDMALAYEIEENLVELYLWWRGLDPVADPPRLRWSGYVRDCEEIDDTTVRLVCENEAARFSRMVGNLLDIRTYPSADPADIGKMIPIAIGRARQVPALAADIGRRTTLPAAITAVAVTFDISDPTGFGGGIFRIDDEDIAYTLNGRTATVTRGVNGTLAAAHAKGAVVSQVRDEYLYIAGEIGPIIDRVYGTIDDLPIDITAVCTLYPAGHPRIPDKAVVSIPGILSVAQLDLLGVTRTGAAVKTGSAIQTGEVWDYSITDPTHTHTASNNLVSQLGSKPTWSGNSAFAVTVTVNFVAISGNFVSQNVNISVNCSVGGGNSPNINIGGVDCGYGTYATVNQGFGAGNSFAITVTPNGSNITGITVTVSQRDYTYTLTINSASSGVSKSPANKGSLDVSDTIGVSDTIMPLLTGKGTVSKIISHRILCDLTSPIYQPFAVCDYILKAWCNDSTLQQVGVMPSWYRLDGAITDYQSAQYWLDYFAFQARSWFVKERGVSRLIVRPFSPHPVKTLHRCLMAGDKRSISISKVPLSDVINIIAVRYDRDWSAVRSADSYAGCISDRNAESIKYYGEREAVAETFFFDFVRNYDMASHLLAYYLGSRSRRHRVYRFTAALDCEDLQFANDIILGFEGGKTVQVTAAEPAPGDSSRFDSITITAVDIYHSWPYMAGDYYSEDYLLSEN